MSRQFRVLCGVPKEHCTGGKIICDQQTNSGKCHSSHEEAFRCMAHYLVTILGFTRVGGREFAPPDGSEIRVLTKKMRYGAHMPWGKERTRFMPERRNAGNRGSIA